MIDNETAEQQAQRLEGKRNNTAAVIEIETAEQRVQRLAGKRKNTAARIASETPEQQSCQAGIYAKN